MKAFKIMPEKNIDFILKCAAYDHVGDKNLIASLCVSVAVQHELQSCGIQNDVSGKLGNGKTHAVRAALKLIGKTHYVEAVMSDKSIFYSKEIHDGTIIFSDDKKISSELEGVIKRAASNFQFPNLHQTIDVNLKPVTKVMPSRILWILTSVSSSNSDELLSRCIQSAIDESEQQTLSVSDLIKNKAQNYEGKYFLPHEDLIKCNEIFKDIKSKWFIITIPYAHNIKHVGRRNLDLLMDVIRGYAILDYSGRPFKMIKRTIATKGQVPMLDAAGEPMYHKGTNNVKCMDAIVHEVVDVYVIEANQDDLKRAMDTYGRDKFGGDSGSETILTDSEKNVLKFIPKRVSYEDYETGITAGELQSKTGLSQTSLSFKLHGRKDRHARGLLEKVPNLHHEQTSVTTSDMNNEVRTTRQVFKYYYDYEESNTIKNKNIDETTEQTRLQVK